MNYARSVVILFVLTVCSILVAGCTSSQPATTSTPVPTAVTTSPASSLQTPGAQPAMECPDKYQKGVWDSAWDTRWVVESHDVRDDAKVWIETGKDDPTGPGPYPVQMTQNCWNVSGTYSPGTGTFSGTIDKNQLKGTYTWVGTSPSDTDYGTFTLTMAADNQSFIGYGKSHTRGEYNDPPNWYGKRV
jgi:hypothetical protein